MLNEKHCSVFAAEGVDARGSQAVYTDQRPQNRRT